MSSRWTQGSGPRGDDYDDRWRRLAAQGHDPHGEANFVDTFAPQTVLDAGCGTGRVGIELARRGRMVVGVDLDEHMLSAARRKAPELEWHQGDLARLDLRHPGGERRHFDVVVLAGNVMIFLAPGSEGDVVHRLADHLEPAGLLIAGFQLGTGHLDLPAYDAHARSAGLELAARYSTWHGDPAGVHDTYAVSVHRRTTVG